jgi:S1-C subfamily serine protease
MKRFSSLAQLLKRVKKFRLSRPKLTPYRLLLAIILILVVGFSSLAIGVAYSISRTAAQALLIKNQEAALYITKAELDDLKKENARLALEVRGETTYLKEETLTLHEQFTTEQSRRLAAEEARDRASLANIVKEWRPIIANVKCGFDGGTQRGSGTLMREDGQLYILTNKHVVFNKGKLPYECTIQFPGRTAQTVATADKTIIIEDSKVDVATIRLDKPNATIVDLVSKHLITKAPGFALCQQSPALGEDVIILGYPAIGGSEDITATEGIIAGFDGNHYVTSAKVERGNSGGAAIHLRQNCYLGIPTFVQSGQIESLARILKASAFFD